MIGVSLRSNTENTYADLIIFPFDVNVTSRIVKRCSGVAIKNSNIVFVYDIDLHNGELTVNDETGNTILNGTDIDRVQGFIVN